MALEKDGTGEGFDLTKPFKTRDGREVTGVEFGRGIGGLIEGQRYHSWLKDGCSCFDCRDCDLVNVAPPSSSPHGAQATGGDWQTLQSLMLKFAKDADYKPTDAELAALSPEGRGVVKGWRLRGAEAGGVSDAEVEAGEHQCVLDAIAGHDADGDL